MQGRIPALVTLKYERMLTSPFGFFRGAVPVMAADLATLPNTGIVSQICGDAHVRNLGAYAAPDGRLIFDINDFDETCTAPFEWDLKRMATSLVLAGRENGQKASACTEAVHTLAASYRKLAATLARMPVADVARYQVHRLQRVTPVSDALHKAERETPQGTLANLTEEKKTGEGKASHAAHAGRRQTPARLLPARLFKQQPPLLMHIAPAQTRAVLASVRLLTVTACCRSAATFSISTGRSMSRSKSWARAVSGCATIWFIWKAMVLAIHSFCRSRKSLVRPMLLIW